MSDDSEDYKTGFKKPPRERQYKPGESGNPKGRPKKPALSPGEEFRLIQAKRVKVNTPGGRQDMSMHGVICNVVANNAAAGKPKAIDQYLRLNEKFSGDYEKLWKTFLKARKFKP